MTIEIKIIVDGVEKVARVSCRELDADAVAQVVALAAYVAAEFVADKQ